MHTDVKYNGICEEFLKLRSIKLVAKVYNIDAKTASIVIKRIFNVKGNVSTILATTLVGQKFNKLEILSWEKRGYYIWVLCQCECGNKHSARIDRLKQNKVKSCGCLQELFHNRANTIDYTSIAVKGLFNQYKSSAKIRNIAFNLSLKVFKVLIYKNCTYCGEKPSKIYKNGAVRFSGILYNGIDRVNSNFGYFSKNCTTCCMICNRIKLNMSLSEFQAYISRVRNNIYNISNTIQNVLPMKYYTYILSKRLKYSELICKSVNPAIVGLNMLYSKYKCSAKTRNLSFLLSKIQFKRLTSQNCHYCGLEPLQVSSHRYKNYARGYYLYNGIDRKDSNMGYDM